MAGYGIATKGISKIIKKLAPKKSKNFPGEKTLEIMNKKGPKYKSPSGKGMDVYERVGRDKSKRDSTARIIKDYRKGKNVGKADSKDPKVQRSQSKVFPQNKKQLVDRVKEVNKDLIKERKENYKGLSGPKKRKTLKLKK